MGGGTYYTQYANAGKLVAIDEYLDQMPNFKAWVEKNPDIWASMQHTDGHVYFTPYFDGLNSIEKMFLMNTSYVEKLLDGEIDAADESVTLTNGTSYTPYVVETEKQKLTVSVDGTAKTITADFAEANNAVKKQNDLSAKNGKALVEALKAALIAEYGSAIAKSAGGSAEGSDVVYNKLSEIFTGEKACYNTDDLVALLRCVKTCPKTLTGDVTTQMNPISPRTAENKRTIDLVSLISLWGLKGNDSENGKLYYDVDGELKDARTTEDTYDVGLSNLNKLYKEGLFVNNFTSDKSGKAMGSTEWRGNNIKDGTGFLYYDYNGTTSPFNDDVLEGSKGFAQPVLAPVVKWADSSKTLNYKGTNLAGTYFRYSEANRALKDGGWCIPAESDNIGTAIALMDYLFSEEGAKIQDFGPDDGKYWDLKTQGQAGNTPYENAVCAINGGTSPIIKQAVLDDIKSNDAGVTWNDYYRAFIGSTQGIGHIREDSLDYQTTYSEKSRDGLSNVQTAIKSGAMILAQTTIDSNTSKFFVSVPQTIAISSDDTSKINASTQNNTLKEVWDSSSSSVICPAINWILIGEDAIKDKYSGGKATMFSEFNTINSVFLEAYSNGAKKIIK